MRGFCIILFMANGHLIVSQDFKTDSLNFATQIDSFKTVNDSLNLSRAFYKMGRLHDIWEKREPAYYYLNEALKLVKALNNNKGMATISNRLACLYSEEGLHTKALGIYFDCIDMLKISGDTNRVPIVLMNIGSEYEIMGDYEKAIEYKLQGLRMKEELKDSSNIAFHYLFVGDVYKLSGNNEKWKYYLDIAYSLRNNEEYADEETVCITYENLASYSKLKNEFDGAMAYYDTLYDKAKDCNHIKSIYFSLSGKAEILSEYKKFDEALKYAEESLSYLPEEQNVLIEHNLFLAGLYLKNKQYQKAVYYLQKNVVKEELIKFPHSRLDTYKLLYKANKKLKNYEQSLFWNEAYQNLSDSIRNIEILKNAEELETQYRTEKKEQQIKQLSAENELERQRIKLAVVTIVALVLAALFVIFWMIIRRRKAKNEQEVLKHQLFRSQMNPHFIFNALASIQNYLYKNQPKIAANYLGNFSSLTRSVLINSTKESISLEEEISTLKNYIELEKMRMKDAFNYELKFDDDLETEIINIPPMLIQPFIENAIKHGLNGEVQGGNLSVSFVDNENHLKVQVLDDGIGINESQKNKKQGHQSKALFIFMQRMQIISTNNKKLPQPIIKDLSTEGKQGTMVELYLPILN